MQRTVTKCDSCDATVVDLGLDGGLAMHLLKPMKKGKMPHAYRGRQWSVQWDLCRTCTDKWRAKLEKKLGSPGPEEDD